MSNAWIVRQAGPVARRVLWRYLCARGADMTNETVGKRCLVLAPHPDDETLGCAVSIMRKVAAGTAVRIVIATDGRHSSNSKKYSADQIAKMRYDECVEACRRLGVAPAEMVWLAFKDSRLADAESALTGKIAAIAEDFRPEEVLTTSVGDPHPDHAALGRVARAVFAHHPQIDVYEYPIWQWRHPRSWLDSCAVPTASKREGAAKLVRFLRSRPLLVSSAGYLPRKHEVLEAYASQLRSITGERDWWYLDQRFLANFFRSAEVFFRVE